MNKLMFSIDVEPKITEESLKQRLINLGWTPPPEPEKWEPEGGDWCFNRYTVTRAQSSNLYSLRKAGVVRTSKEEAKIALAGQKRRNLLSSWAAKNGGEQPFVKGENNWYVLFNGDSNKAINHSNTYYYHFESVYMTKEAAEKFCEWYNEGRIDL